MRLEILLSALFTLALAVSDTSPDNGLDIFQAYLGNPKKTSGNITSQGVYPSLENLFRRATTCAAGYGLCTSGYCCRLTEGCCPGGCAPSGASCCGATKYCDAGELCCLQGTPGCCEKGETCCGDKCMPSDAKCCNASGDYCTASNICVFFEGYVNPYCCTDLKCTAYVSGGRTISRTTTVVATTTRNTQITTTPAATLVGGGVTSRYFYYTVTWSYVYYYWYYSIAIQASVVTTSYVTATTTVSVYATATAQADRSLDSITADFTTPYSATTLRPSYGSTTRATQATATGTTSSTTSRSSTATAAVAGLSAAAHNLRLSESWYERILAIIVGVVMWYV